MKNTKNNFTIVLEIVFVLFFLVSLTNCNSNSAKDLPIYNPSDLNPALVDHSVRDVTKNHHVADFHLINQNGKVITQADYDNKIYVADFIFTRCATICLAMTNNMGELQNKFKDDKDVKLLSISVTPLQDSVAVLREYADRNNVDDSKWNITTGNKRHIYELARKSYFAVTDDGDGGLQDFIHTPNFVLVDSDKQIRGIYDGTRMEEIKQLINDVQILKKSLSR